MATPASKPAEEQKRPKQGRSPAYPGIDLEKAVVKAKALYDAEGKYPAPMSSAFKAWGFSAKSSGGRETRAALRYFGLIVIEGDGETGKVKLTDKALRVLLDDREDQSEKLVLIQELALTPKVHKEIYEKFPDGIKSDATVEHFLVFDEGFNKSAAGEVVAVFKATALYAGLFQPDNMVVKDDHEGLDPMQQMSAETKRLLDQPASSIRRPMLQEVFNLDEGPVTLTFPAELTTTSYEDLKSYFDLFLRKAKRQAEKRREESGDPEA